MCITILSLRIALLILLMRRACESRVCERARARMHWDRWHTVNLFTTRRNGAAARIEIYVARTRIRCGRRAGV